ncbi:sigma-54 interaction domain-containing protein [Caenibacillus caldisaponilyticus]|uniref:sigma-54 interaction domain-containing protein n=1 Tax=Caenibacillus caldisaponilyticus TaxID=1674942 RepID=UPI00098882DA|nr:sigma 54-interacting transcriptional regulator [Caenibacillus caldisaponilyticus]
MSKKRIAIVGYEECTVEAIVRQLHEIRLHEYFDIEGFVISELYEKKIDPGTLVVATSAIVEIMAKPYLPAEAEVIVAKRMINFANIRELFQLRQGMKVLVVSNMKEAVDETIKILKELGIRLEYAPYYPGAPKPDAAIKVAITPGDINHVPDTIETVINVGVRFLDISTIIEIFHKCAIPDMPYNLLSARYLNSLLSVTSQLSDEIFTTKMLRNSLEQVVEHVDEALILYTEERNIQFINKKAADILGIDEREAVGQKIDGIGKPSFFRAIRSIEEGLDVFKEIDHVTYYIRKQMIHVDGRIFGTLVLFREANEIQKLEHRYREQTKRKHFVAKYSFKDMVTASDSIRSIIRIAKKLAKSDSTILILGETGTGKEVLAQSIHRASARRDYPFVGVNFSAFSESLLESELFGYEGGAFTGARKSGKSGLFEQAHKGTMFLDEIGDASPAIQLRLLRVLQEKEIMRVGGEQVIPLDVRIIAATNRDLERLIEEGRFRQDLFYRLNVLPIYLPPLRERKEDIVLLTDCFVRQLCAELGRRPPRFSERAMKAMRDYHWPGNVRQLRNVIEYLLHVVEDDVDAEHLPFVSGIRFVNAQDRSSDRLKSLFDEIKQKGFLDDVTTILSALNDGGEASAGRPALLQSLSERGIRLTDQQLRYRQNLMREWGLIKIHRGRKGSTITEKGKAFLQYVGKRGT